MAFSILRSTSQIPEIEKEDDGEFDLLECTEIEVGTKAEDIGLGFQFAPKDDDIVAFYLFNKILDRVLPVTDIIKKIDDLHEYDPNQLPIGDFMHGHNCNEALYFTYIEQIYSSEGKVTKRTTRGGYWKVIGEEREIKYRRRDVTIGFRTSMVYYRGQAPNGRKTPFLMHEYRLNPRVVPIHLLNDTIRTKMDRYVVWRIINKRMAKYDLS